MDFSVQKTAKLAYLELSEAEQAKFETQFEQILKYVDQLKEVPMSEAEAKEMGAFHIQSAFYERFKTEPLLKLRSDDPSSPELNEVNKLVLNNDEAVRNAPTASGLPNAQLFEVPSIISR